MATTSAVTTTPTKNQTHLAIAALFIVAAAVTRSRQRVRPSSSQVLPRGTARGISEQPLQPAIALRTVLCRRTKKRHTGKNDGIDQTACVESSHNSGPEKKRIRGIDVFVFGAKSSLCTKRRGNVIQPQYWIMLSICRSVQNSRKNIESLDH